MNEELLALAHRLIANPRWVWLPGMACLAWDGTDGFRFGASDPDTPDTVQGPIVPDLTDPATLGCVLYLVREAWGDDGATSYCVRLYDPTDGDYRGWVVRAFDHSGISRQTHGESEAHALVAALEAAP